MNIGANSKQQLQSIIERMENLNEQISGLKADQKEILQEAKSSGFDPATIRAVIKLRAEDAEKRANREALLETYLHALGQLDGTPLGQSAIEREFA